MKKLVTFLFRRVRKILFKYRLAILNLLELLYLVIKYQTPIK